ncbi:hypothetical protein WUBG_19117 [Wuchereria bancrofti]|nr:hypothetical protein WUBG_19117 [Wuchereria bancrofti]
MLLELYVGALETSNTKWIEHIAKATPSKKREGDISYASYQREALFFVKKLKLLTYKSKPPVEAIDMPDNPNKARVLFDSGAQATCISKKLAKRLSLQITD